MIELPGNLEGGVVVLLGLCKREPPGQRSLLALDLGVKVEPFRLERFGKLR